MQEIPLILVGTQGKTEIVNLSIILLNSITIISEFKNTITYSFLDAISENQPRVIDDSRARKLASDLKRCSYYETCATYGLNVERVFQDGKLIQHCNIMDCYQSKPLLTHKKKECRKTITKMIR